MNKIRVIDLLNKIANNEKFPKKIKYMNSIWEYEKDGNMQDFQNEIGTCLMEVIPINRDGLHAFRLKGVYQPEPPKVEEPKQEVIVDNTKVKELEEQTKILKISVLIS